MAWALALAAITGAGASIWGAEQGANATDKAAKQNINLARENRDIGIALNEPNRALGYGATSDLATLYGYNIPRYTPGSQLMTGGGGAAGGAAGGGASALYGSNANAPITVDGRRADGGYGMSVGGIGWNSGSNQRRFGGQIDPVTGQVDLKNIKNGKKEAKLEAAATAYLRGETDKLKGKKLKRVRGAIDDLRGGGYEYDPEAAARLAAERDAAANFNPAAPGSAGNPGQQYFDPLDPNSNPNLPPAPAGQAPGQPAAGGGAGNFSRFFTSPDYQWRLDQQNKAVERSAAARGGLFRGATGTALARESGNMASQEFGNYFERLMRMNGQGGAATNNTVSSVGGGNSAAILANTNAANARASSYADIGGAVNNLAQNLYYGYQRRA